MLEREAGVGQRNCRVASGELLKLFRLCPLAIQPDFIYINRNAYYLMDGPTHCLVAARRHGYYVCTVIHVSLAGADTGAFSGGILRPASASFLSSG
ncbi:hypothetical protein FVF58_47665 [Paraburkholderia panacisoli]|uniref:Uncharacterized protein n=1 Tax=Paraburkholderia panacisoli TaxID=2603818 RepID=A0A5B0G550_9BURK|nr:hypothetical protein [Paraburkholderia panacisoli]KAA0997775.1 hypothetical protein FVF58_47665 [Paraburkholderia panacisoli]